VVSYSREGSDRLLAVVFLGPTNVNVEMIAQGLAKLDWGVACPAYCRDLKVAERKAKRDRVGLWGQGASGESLAALQRRVGIEGD
jgi:endonuclease YncB( thermonuclease family)